MPIYVALLRGINVGGHNKISMSELCALCTDQGWSNTASYIQSGNLVFEANTGAANLENDLEQTILKHYGLKIDSVVRSAEQWEAYISNNPYPEQSAQDPAHVMLALSKALPPLDVAEQLRARALGGEEITQVGDMIWIYFDNGMASSKLTSALLDRLVGSPVTMRNWRTVLKLGELIQSRMGKDCGSST